MPDHGSTIRKFFPESTTIQEQVVVVYRMEALDLDQVSQITAC
jgi:hypothetical protein